ncbi:MAG: class I fructose-bisphosphate aldolase [Patescibacteria group bacterium]
MTIQEIKNTIGFDSHNLLDFQSQTFDQNLFNFPSPSSIDEIFAKSNRNNRTLRNLADMYNFGRLANTGYLSILPVDQGVEHSAGASFAKNPAYFDPENLVKLALMGGCNAIASTIGTLALTSRTYAHKIPFIVKLNHNEFLTYPNKFDQVMFTEVEEAYNLGAVGVGATVYFGSSESSRQIEEVSAAFSRAHELGMFTILWCYLRNPEFKKAEADYHNSADLSGQANYLGVTIQADIIKQKLPKNNGGYKALNSKENPYGKTDESIYDKLTTAHPIDLTRYQLANCYMGKIPLINSGGVDGDNDLKEAVKTAIINKRAGGSGLILGRKAFKKDLGEGIEILKAVQDVYLCKEVKVA